ncbi:uncharacterized protein LOC118801113 [Colossoma macropomum]|uniref:uncharacterized protein LOC118801113 n=1 Tax=Colossoma macropomum TaxID=42526 RepID=UPI001864FD83|nr:uncharacterized protein LOC118801113 [Colossoma macropomum]
MQSCSSAHCILILLTITLTAVSESAVTPVKVNLHDSATLPCSERCSGLVRWTVFHKPTDALAECDQTSCRSVKEGYQMIHDQYLKGNFSLTITDADFTKKHWYTCDCDGKDLCDVNLQIEALKTTVQKKTGESLMLKLDIPEEVEVIYNSTGAAGSSSGQICTVNGRSTDCKPEYANRAFLTSALELRAVTPSDSGVYTVMDKRNEDAVHVFTVTVQDCEPCICKEGAALPGWVVPVLVVLAVALAAVLAVCVILVVKNKQLQSKNQQHPEAAHGNGNANHVPMTVLGNNGAEEQQRLAEPSNHQAD